MDRHSIGRLLQLIGALGIVALYILKSVILLRERARRRKSMLDKLCSAKNNGV